MSIINDALKKTQNDINRNAGGDKKGPPPNKPKTASGDKEPRRKGSLKKLTFIFIFLCITIGVGAVIATQPEVLQSLDTTKIKAQIQSIPSKIKNLFPSNNNKTTSSKAKSDSVTMLEKNNLSVSPQLTKVMLPNIDIAGVMKVGNEYVALIGDDVYEKGHTIKGALIEQINERNVIFNFEGKQFTVGLSE